MPTRPKNILIFSDGTGMAGGITFDENRTNIYKLYRATRCGPDSCIDPVAQVAFYDAGLGSPADGSFIHARFLRWVYNKLSQATGLGLTANVIDCYAALIRLYRDGDRVFLFGFSRGAYTIRSLAGVIARCGIPRHLPGGRPLPLDLAGSRRLARAAVKNVYQFCPSRPRTAGWSYRNFLLDARARIAARFRQEHGSAEPAAPGKANVHPYFIGAFDTVAALGRPGAMALFGLAFAAVTAGASLALSLLSGLADVPHVGWLLARLSFENVLGGFALVGGVALLAAYATNYVKFDFRVPGYPWWKRLATLHLAPPRHRFTDYSLDVNVVYAKHAISIDENRKDFARVPWAPDATRAGTRDPHGNLHFEQVWFAGVHTDVGGGYPENESRLSDITLRWMLAAASVIPDGIVVDERVLRLSPAAAGPQHDEYKAGWWQRGGRDLPVDAVTRTSRAVMHKSVYARFEADDVVLYDVRGRYRPANLRVHVDFAHYFDGSRHEPEARACVADDIESKWERKRKEAGPAR